MNATERPPRPTTPPQIVNPPSRTSQARKHSTGPSDHALGPNGSSGGLAHSTSPRPTSNATCNPLSQSSGPPPRPDHSSPALPPVSLHREPSQSLARDHLHPHHPQSSANHHIVRSDQGSGASQALQPAQLQTGPSSSPRDQSELASIGREKSRSRTRGVMKDAIKGTVGEIVNILSAAWYVHDIADRFFSDSLVKRCSSRPKIALELSLKNWPISISLRSMPAFCDPFSRLVLL